MFLAVRTLVRIAALATFLVVVSTAPLADAAGRPPTSGQIRLAIRRAEQPGALWATVNICNSHRYPGRLGIRGQMPSLGFAASMSMNIQVDYLNQANHRFRPVPGASRAIGFRATTGLHQEAGPCSPDPEQRRPAPSRRAIRTRTSATHPTSAQPNAESDLRSRHFPPGSGMSSVEPAERATWPGRRTAADRW